MSGTTKRLDLQFGVFACSVQGFDDPVQPVQQVLQALQNLLEETPEISDAGISFDAAAIERLVGEVARRADIDEENVEIVPGLIIVHRGNDYSATGDTDAYGAADDTTHDGGGEAWSQPFVAGAADTGDTETPASEPDNADIPEAAEDVVEDTGPGFVNIFAPGADGDVDTESDPGSDPFSAAAETDAVGTDPYAEAGDGPEDSSLRDIFADTGESADGNIFADPMAENAGAEPGEPEDEPLNLFAAPSPADESADESGDPGNVFTSADTEGAGPEDTGEEEPEDAGEESERVEALFGRSEDQPVVEEADEGYTAAGLAQTAGAESVAELMVSAAAWMVLIQGQTTFTRHEVIDVFETMPGKHSKTLESRIKGFGRATRNGQLIMVEEGVYGLSRTELERFQQLL